MSKKLNFDELHRKYCKLVFQVAYKYSKNRTAAEDIVQDTFLKLHISIETIDQSKINNWLYTTAKHEALNFKKKQSKLILGDEQFEKMKYPSVEEQYLDKESTYERLGLYSEIMLGLMDKNPRWKQAMSMVYEMGIPQAVVAKEMGISLNVLHSLLRRARVWVKKEYGVVFVETNQQ